MPAMDTSTAMTVADRPRPALQHGDARATLAHTLVQLADRLSAPRLAVAVIAIGDACVALSVGEQAQLRRLRAPGRRRNWLAGRAALKAVRQRSGSDTDTSTLRFPDPCTSLTHAAGFAISVAAARGALRGLGVDLEARRETSPGAGRFFLTDSERDWLERQPADRQPDERIRLWTVKEAVYKACADNRGIALSRIRLRDPAAGIGEVAEISGLANRAANGNGTRYASGWTPAGCVSLALLPTRRCQVAGIAGYPMGRKQ